MLCTLWKTFEHVFIPCLMGISGSPPDESEYPNSVRLALRQRLIPVLRSLASSLRVWESVQKEYTNLTESPHLFTGNETGEELRAIARVPEKLTELELFMRGWGNMVRQMVSESNRLRKEMDRNGPQDEVEYWKSRASKLAILHRKMRSPEMKLIIYCLQSVGSEALKAWKGLEHKVLFCFTEAKDNSAYIDRIATICHSLYLDDPVQIKGDAHCLLQTVMMIQSTSMYYNTSERISHLLVKVRKFNKHIEPNTQSKVLPILPDSFSFPSESLPTLFFVFWIHWYLENSIQQASNGSTVKIKIKVRSRYK